MWKAREAQNDAIQWGVDVESLAASEEGWPGVPADALWPYQIGADGWLSIEGEVKVQVEVRSVIEEVEGLPVGAYDIVHRSVTNLLSSLCHSSIGTSIGSCASLGSR
jgi:hypothetical protein